MKLMVTFAAAALVFVLYGSSIVVDALTSSQRQVALDEHNTRRSKLAKGNEPAYDGGFMPKGKNIYKLTYSTELEGYAQSWANGCVYQHSPASSRPNAGENLYYSSAVLNASVALSNAAALFWKENVEDGVPKDRNLTMDVFNRGVGHFTQMAWAKTTKLGCGVGYCSGQWKTFVVCNYRAPGNYINQLIYEAGNPCTKNSDCTTYSGSTCETSSGLCLTTQ